MNNIKIPNRGESLPVELATSQDIILKCTNNANVPGNAALLADFAEATEVLSGAYSAVQVAAIDLSEKRALIPALTAAWRTARSALAAFTASATKGDPAKVLSTGFEVPNEAMPVQPVEQVLNFRVQLNGKEGHTRFSWTPEINSYAYIIQCGTDPNDPSTFKYYASCTGSRYEGNGVEPGKRCYFRVAGLNSLGQGPWSDMSARPVM